MCESKFTSKQTLRRHKEHKHDGIEYKCDICDFKCSDKSKFSKHKINIHTISKLEEKIEVTNILQNIVIK